jgi:uncharacterized protein DUF3592
MTSHLFGRIFDRLRRRNPDIDYLTWLERYGRITDGMVMDSQSSDEEVTIFYNYNISNVEYESSQALTAEQLDRQHEYRPGVTVTVRYDPRHPARSMVQ